MLKGYDKDNMPDEMVAKLLQKLKEPNMDPAVLDRTGKSLVGLG